MGTKGVNVNFDASNGCSISGKYKNTGKKQSFSGLSIDGFVTAAPTTIPPTTTAGATPRTTLAPASQTLLCSEEVTPTNIFFSLIIRNYYFFCLHRLLRVLGIQ